MYPIENNVLTRVFNFHESVYCSRSATEGRSSLDN